MSKRNLIIGCVLAMGGGLVMAGQAVDALNMGLSKTSVFDVPDPEPFHYNDIRPKKSKALPRAYPGAPPQIPHRVDDALPIMAGDNLCLDCHDKPDKWGEEVKEGKGTPMPSRRTGGWFGSMRSR